MQFHGVFCGSLVVLKSCRIIGRWFGALNVLIHSIFAAPPPKRLFQPLVLFLSEDYLYLPACSSRMVRPGAGIDIIREGFCCGDRGLPGF